MSQSNEDLIFNMLSDVAVKVISTQCPKLVAPPWGYIVIKAIQLAIKYFGKPIYQHIVREGKMVVRGREIRLNIDKLIEAKNEADLADAFNNLD